MKSDKFQNYVGFICDTEDVASFSDELCKSFIIFKKVYWNNNHLQDS